MDAISKDALNNLLSVGRRQGHLTTTDLTAALPISAMSPDEIATIVVQLEESGIPVELDEGLLRGRGKPSVLPKGGPDFAVPEGSTAQAPPQGQPPDPRTGPQIDTEPSASAPGAHMSVILAGLLVAAVLALLVYGLSLH
jgi:hypothetical protein